MAFRMRNSKFRHVFGSAAKKEQCYEGIKITKNAHDGNFCAVNPSFLAVVTESSGGGSFLVLPINKVGRVDINAPRVIGHAGPVLDIKWNPYDDHVIASSSDDSTVKLWQIPKGGLRNNLDSWLMDLHGHMRRVGYLEWHPTAANILLSAGYDFNCILWNTETAAPVNVISVHQENIFSISWNRDGSLFATTSKDKRIRVIDPRDGSIAAEGAGHVGSKASKVVFLGNKNRLFTTGFSRTSERQYGLWDVRNMSKCMKLDAVDASSGLIFPFYDHDTGVVFLAGKGDGNIRYYEVVDEPPFCCFLSQYQSGSPQRGLGIMPKRGIDPSKNEIARFYKLHAEKGICEPLSMIVPRKSETFQDDLFPCALSHVPALSANAWLSGQNSAPILISLKDGSLQPAPAITTYKAVKRSTGTSFIDKKTHGPASAPSRIPASLMNIAKLSRSNDTVDISQSTGPAQLKQDLNDNYPEVYQPPVEDPRWNFERRTGQKQLDRSSSDVSHRLSHLDRSSLLNRSDRFNPTHPERSYPSNNAQSNFADQPLWSSQPERTSAAPQPSWSHQSERQASRGDRTNPAQQLSWTSLPERATLASRLDLATQPDRSRVYRPYDRSRSGPVSRELDNVIAMTFEDDLMDKPDKSNHSNGFSKQDTFEPTTASIFGHQSSLFHEVGDETSPGDSSFSLDTLASLTSFDASQPSQQSPSIWSENPLYSDNRRMLFDKSHSETTAGSKPSTKHQISLHRTASEPTNPRLLPTPAIPDYAPGDSLTNGQDQTEFIDNLDSEAPDDTLIKPSQLRESFRRKKPHQKDHRNSLTSATLIEESPLQSPAFSVETRKFFKTEEILNVNCEEPKRFRSELNQPRRSLTGLEELIKPSAIPELTRKINRAERMTDLGLPSSPSAEDKFRRPSDPPASGAMGDSMSESEMKRAYGQQQEEIRSLKNELTMKDWRLRKLEEEVTQLRLELSAAHGESNC